MTTCPNPVCEEQVEGEYCESCGWNVVTRQGPELVASLVLGADRAHYERMVDNDDRQTLPYPEDLERRRFELTGEVVTVGRVSPGKEVDVDIAFTGETADPGISHRQCVFARDGEAWTVRDGDGADRSSTNGTFVNERTEPLASAESHQIVAGDRICIGAWTCLTFEVD